MKKTVLIAVFTYISMTTISCTADVIEKDNLKIDNITKATKIVEPTLFADGPGDDVIPIKH